MLSTFGAFSVEWFRSARRTKADRESAVHRACSELISRAHGVVIRAEALRVLASVRSGLSERIDTMLYRRKPLDPLEINDYLLREMTPTFDAEAIIWTTGDSELIGAAGKLTDAMWKVVGNATALPTVEGDDLIDTAVKKSKSYLLGYQLPAPGSDPYEKQVEAIRELGRARAAFVSIARTRLGIDDPDAVYTAFPGLAPVGDDKVEPKVDTADSSEPNAND